MMGISYKTTVDRLFSSLVKRAKGPFSPGEKNFNEEGGVEGGEKDVERREVGALGISLSVSLVTVSM